MEYLEKAKNNSVIDKLIPSKKLLICEEKSELTPYFMKDDNNDDLENNKSSRHIESKDKE